MPEQPVPAVTDADVRRVARREFGEEKLPLVLAIVGEFGQQAWNQPSPRVQLAILKLAAGDIARLKQATRTAIEDYRDVLAAAEYPCYGREIGLEDAAGDTARKVIAADWQQYRAWLDRR